jgi:hypothetical protein
MLGLATRLKQLDNQHAATAAGTRMSCGDVFIDLGGFCIYARSEHVARLGDGLGFGRTGKQIVVADAVEAPDNAESRVEAGLSWEVG